MDKSLDEIIGERPSRGGRRPAPDRRAPPPRGPRRDRDREEGPRDGASSSLTLLTTSLSSRLEACIINEPLDWRQALRHANLSEKYRRDEPVSIDTDWVHDRYDDDRHDRRQRRQPAELDRYDSGARPQPAPRDEGAKLRIDNLHYDLTEEDLKELFTRIGPIASIRLLYDRMDRSQGTAFVTYEDHHDARDAVRQFDGQNANGQPIRLTLLPSAPRGERAPQYEKERNLFDRIEAPGRSLFDRIERTDSREASTRRRSMSPRRSKPLSDSIDRYVPGRRASRSPIRRRGTPKDTGRRPGERREQGDRGDRSERGGRGGRRADEEGRAVVGGRPRKTAEELDAEMADYWGKDNSAASTNDGPAAATKGQNAANGATGGAAPEVAMDDADMID